MPPGNDNISCSDWSHDNRPAPVVFPEENTRTLVLHYSCCLVIHPREWEGMNADAEIPECLKTGGQTAAIPCLTIGSGGGWVKHHLLGPD